MLVIYGLNTRKKYSRTRTFLETLAAFQLPFLASVCRTLERMANVAFARTYFRSYSIAIVARSSVSESESRCIFSEKQCSVKMHTRSI